PQNISRNICAAPRAVARRAIIFAAAFYRVADPERAPERLARALAARNCPIAITLLLLLAVLRQNPIHLRFQQLRLSFSQPKISRSKFDPGAEGSFITAS